MRAKSILLILIALGCGLVASIAISQVMERNRSTNGGLEMVQIYVATADIDVNEQLTASNVRVEDWPKSKVPEGVVVDFKEVNERFARVRFYQGEPILKPKLANEIEVPAVKIPDGERVCSLKVQMDTAVSGLVNPGDRVDIYGYFKEGRGIPSTGTREILKNARVFAVNDQTAQEIDQEGRTIVAKTVSVLVKQDQVAKLMLATELGTLRLALRRPNETAESSRGESATVESLFGTRSESADQPQRPTPVNQLASATGGFVGFLNGLKSQTAPTAPSAADPQPRSPAWQMMLLTPEGGTQFTWSDEDGLPESSGSDAPVTPALQTPAPQAPPASPTPTPTPVTGQTPSADSGAPQPESTSPNKSVEPNQSEEKD
jgi:pilus assembly protein CpaB